MTDGHDALLVPPGDTQALATAIRRLLEDPELALQISRQARVTAERFTPHAIASEYWVYFTELQQRSRKGG
ncbi:MAG: hypothetical protein IPI01_21060 [Ignavibacteriae bacterium]|nr:hypothetical protein [Ignavibacteriota bacterium]